MQDGGPGSCNVQMQRSQNSVFFVGPFWIHAVCFPAETSAEGVPLKKLFRTRFLLSLYRALGLEESFLFGLEEASGVSCYLCTARRDVFETSRSREASVKTKVYVSFIIGKLFFVVR